MCSRYLVLKTGGSAGVLCEDVFENMVRALISGVRCLCIFCRLNVCALACHARCFVKHIKVHIVDNRCGDQTTLWTEWSHRAVDIIVT